MPEWLNGPASKTGDSNRFEGSNPSLSFIKKVDPTGVCLFYTNSTGGMRTLYFTTYIFERVKSTAPTRITIVEMVSFLRPCLVAYSPKTNTPHIWFTTRFSCKSG